MQPFMTTLAAKGLAFQQALFVPPESSYRKLGSPSPSPDHHPKDLSWQQGLQKVYQTHLTSSSIAGVTTLLGALPSLSALVGCCLALSAEAGALLVGYELL